MSSNAGTGGVGGLGVAARASLDLFAARAIAAPASPLEVAQQLVQEVALSLVLDVAEQSARGMARPSVREAVRPSAQEAVRPSLALEVAEQSARRMARPSVREAARPPAQEVALSLALEVAQQSARGTARPSARGTARPSAQEAAPVRCGKRRWIHSRPCHRGASLPATEKQNGSPCSSLFKLSSSEPAHVTWLLHEAPHVTDSRATMTTTNGCCDDGPRARATSSI